MGALSWQHLLIVLIIVLVLFGGSRLAGLGKSTGRALREFKEETKDLRGNKAEETANGTAINTGQPVNTQPQDQQIHQQVQQPTPQQTTGQQGEFVNPVQPTDQRRDG